MAYDSSETCVDHIIGDKHITLTASEQWSVNLVHRLKKRCPDEVDIRYTNPDGSMLVHLPKKWLKISPPRKVSEEQKETARQRMLEYHNT